MTEAAWLVVAVALILLLVAIRRTPEIGERIEDWIKGFFIFVFISFGALALIYGVVKFIRWAWYN